MATKKTTTKKYKGIQFLAGFWAVAFCFFLLKLAFPEIAGKHLREVEAEVREIIEHPLSHSHHTDSIDMARRHVDSLFLCPRQPLQLTDAQGNPVKHKVLSVRSYKDAFPDLNDVQLATAERLGQPECKDREEAAAHRERYVSIATSPYFDLERLTYSQPYLVPRAARLLDEIGRAFLDSLAAKGYPFHKMVVTSVLRTEEDVKRLRRRNANASEQSCHRFGTTFDISYNIYHRVQDPDLPPQTETWGVTLKQVLAEVLRDQRELGTCYVKYEVKQSCFHITCR